MHLNVSQRMDITCTSAQLKARVRGYCLSMLYKVVCLSLMALARRSGVEVNIGTVSLLGTQETEKKTIW